MPHRKLRTRRRTHRVALLTLAALAFWALRRDRPGRDAAPEQPTVVPGWASSPAPSSGRARRRLRPRRFATSVAFAALFFTGASFSAFAGNGVVALLEPGDEAAQVEAAPAAPEAEPAAAAAPAEPVVEPAPVADPAPAAGDAPAADPASAASGHIVDPEVAEPAPPAEVPAAEPEAVAEAPAAEAEALADAASGGEADQEVRAESTRKPPAAPKTSRRAAGKAPAPVRPAAHPVHLDPEASEPSSVATVWVHRVMPDPTPASLRLAPETAARLRRAARRARVDWALLLGAVRADGSRRGVPARQATLAETAERLAELGARRNAWSASLALTGRTAAADRAVALAHYYRAVGLQTLVDGLLARQEFLAKKVLADERVDLYSGGREDVEAGRIDVRVLALIAYLADSYGQVTVSSLFSGHRLYARPGVVSAHIYGQAVDISALGEKSIAGNQEPGGLTEKAVRDILLLPAEMRPRQVISLLGLGGPSFPLANHGDHIHVGF